MPKDELAIAKEALIQAQKVNDAYRDATTELRDAWAEWLTMPDQFPTDRFFQAMDFVLDVEGFELPKES